MRQDIEALLAQVAAGIADRNAGIFGPDSMSWRINRESALFLGAGRAALLQLAHPWVASALQQHSSLLNKPIARFHNTFRIVFTMVFGTADQAFAASRNLYALHTRISGVLAEDTARWKRGDRYQANEINALRWVFATLVDSALLAHETVFGALPPDDRERYYQETKTLAALFGIPATQLPANAQDFTAYMRKVCEAGDSSGALGVTADARDMAHNLFAGAGSWINPPLWYRALTASWLPARFREEFQLDFGPARRTALPAKRAMQRLLRNLPQTSGNSSLHRSVARRHRLAWKAKPFRRAYRATLSNRFWIGDPQMPFGLEK